MSQGIKIAKPGYTISASPENLYVDSDTPILKIAFQKSGTQVFDASAGASHTITVAHSLGYYPQFAVYSEYVPSSGILRLVSSSAQVLGSDKVFVKTAVDTTNLIIILQDNLAGDPSGTYTYMYQIYYDPTF